MYIFVDFEMHPVSRARKDARRIASNEIIQFGAVMFDDELNELDRFCCLVKPWYVDKFDPVVLGLTHIKPEQLKKADNFCSVYRQFIRWCETYGQNYTIYSWNSIDEVVIQKEIKLKKFRENASTRYMFANWVDYQKEFTDRCGAASIVSLANAMKVCNTPKNGKAHDALVDALDMAEIFKYMKNKPDMTALFKEFKNLIQSRTTVLKTYKYEYRLETDRGSTLSFNVYRVNGKANEKLIRIPVDECEGGCRLVTVLAQSEDEEEVEVDFRQEIDEEFVYFYVPDEKKNQDN